MPVKVQDIGSKDLPGIRQLPRNEATLKMQRLAIRSSPSDVMGAEIRVDTTHMDILRKLKLRQISDIEKKYNVKMEERKLNGSRNPGRGQTGASSGDPLNTSRSSANTQKEEPDLCPICLCEPEEKVILEKCKHAYCRECLKRATAYKPVCAICGVSYGTVTGDQPDGTMNETRHRISLPGYPGCGTIEITYHIPGGTQKENHPRPGRSFSGTRRRAYLPDNKEGRDILLLLKRAFDQRLIFTVGESRTTGATDTVTWNDVHHKTSTHGGPQSFGYPDPDYLSRVRDELRAKGIQ
ncbi:E3 ubiquitin-protein ligase DTX3L-like [Rana temporaria]|uniref:E3 ubiquitin-protein ligase DTX3L-like n=1 Tax=Rana temporaria TaxID=8407 RepID=UPI001AADB3BF|nr:E3 ubiquitin-protein ligase DTX3L-like [Rana temporaria]